MAITYGEVKSLLAKYAGTAGVCQNAAQLDSFVREVLDYLLISGTYGNEHKFCFCAVRGCITLPYELETPLKIKIDNCIGTVWDRWFEFHQTKYLPDCLPAARGILEEPNYFPTVYDIPEGGAQVGVVGICAEDETAHVIVKGFDPTGREIITTHKGEQIIGEYLSIRKGEMRYTNVVFGKITEIYKTPTKGYVQLYWLNREANLKGFLADYSPLEEKPEYRRFRLTDPCCQTTHRLAKVSILGRLRLKPYYADNDLIPFDNRYILNLGGQVINANYNNATDLSKAKKQDLQEAIEQENDHKKINNGKPVEFYLPTSAGNIRNII